MSGKFKFDQNRTKTENLHEGLPKFMVTLVTDVNMAALLPRLLAFLSLWLHCCLTSSWLYSYQGYQSGCRCYGYLGYWRHSSITKVTSVSVVMVTLVTDVSCTVTKVTRISILTVTLVTYVTKAVLLPRLPAFLSLWLLCCLTSSWLYRYQGYQSDWRCYGYLG
jgi:hypothetical protein